MALTTLKQRGKMPMKRLKNYAIGFLKKIEPFKTNYFMLAIVAWVTTFSLVFYAIIGSLYVTILQLL